MISHNRLLDNGAYITSDNITILLATTPLTNVDIYISPNPQISTPIDTEYQIGKKYRILLCIITIAMIW